MAHPLANPASGAPVRSSEEMIAELYAELRALAAARLARLPAGHTLQGTALVHEAYLRVSAPGGEAKWQNRAHFFASAAEAMRRVLVDHARKKNALRRGGALQFEPLADLQIASPHPDDRILEVHEALDELERENPKAANVVKLRFFAGLGHDEIAALLEISEKTARRLWDQAKVYLYERIAAKKNSAP